MINEYIFIAGMAYLLGSSIGATLWFTQGVRIMNDCELRAKFDYYWYDVFMCTLYGVFTSWFGVFMYWRISR